MEFIQFRLTCTFGNRIIVGHLVKWTIVIILNCALISIKYRVVFLFVCFSETGIYFGQFLYERCIRKNFLKSQEYRVPLYSCTLAILFIKDLPKIPVRGLTPLLPESVTVLHKVK